MSTTTKNLKGLLQQIDSGELSLPEIQRDFVWNRKNVLLLFDSLYRGLPIGYMLVWKAKVAVSSKKFRSRSQKKQNLDSFYGYLLDGQQRLTSIQLVRDGDDDFPLMFALKPDSEDKLDENRFIYSSRKNVNDPWYISVQDVLSSHFSSLNVLKRLKRESEDYSERKHADQVLASLTKLANIMNYEIGIIEFEDDNYRSATELFIRFNSTGKKLKITDLISAELALTVPEIVSDGINRCCTRYSPEFSFSSTFLIQCLVAVHTGKLNLKNPKEVWAQSTEKEIKKSWNRTELGISRVIEFLSGTMKWNSITWLPSVNAIIPLIFLLSKDKFSLKERDYARNWLIKANIYAIFSGSAHSELDRILRNLSREPELERLLKITQRDTGAIKPIHFETRRTSGATMSLFITMLRNCNAKDWLNKTPLDGSVIGHNAELQVHHFFPKALLQSKGYNSNMINTFANYTIINKDSNICISAEEPVKYLSDIKLSKKDLQDQCIPQDKSLWTVENYVDFLVERRRLLAKSANLLLKIN
ncbi:DUF262 domain-containing protein [bacterium]|nr:DUF262 domain-containing protein [bacterium]MBU1025522.1 DUF262 domain-containing protein [bacterium]